MTDLTSDEIKAPLETEIVQLMARLPEGIDVVAIVFVQALGNDRHALRVWTPGEEHGGLDLQQAEQLGQYAAGLLDESVPQ